MGWGGKRKNWSKKALELQPERQFKDGSFALPRAVVRYPRRMKPLGECLACFGFNFFQRTKVMQIQEEGDNDRCYKGRRKPTPNGLKDRVYTEHKDFLTGCGLLGRFVAESGKHAFLLGGGWGWRGKGRGAGGLERNTQNG